VPKRMAGGVLGDPSLPCRVMENALNASLIHMVAALLSCVLIRVKGRRRKDELPVPLGRCIRVLS
jgi:hypothetical protein